jgi:hypothetical protein
MAPPVISANDMITAAVSIQHSAVSQSIENPAQRRRAAEKLKTGVFFPAVLCGSALGVLAECGMLSADC